MSSPSLEQLFRAFLATGDEAALDQLMRRSAPALRRLARRLGAGPEDAEDLVQETIVAAIQGADRYDASRPLLPWLKGILTFRSAKWARDELRRRRAYAMPAADESSAATAEQPAAAAAGRELDDDVRAAIASLPLAYRAPLQQYLLAGRSPLEIAQGLGLQRATVRVRLHRGIGRLRELLGRWVGVVLALLLGRRARAASAPAWAAAAAGVALGTAVAVGAVLVRSGPAAPPVTERALGAAPHEPSAQPPVLPPATQRADVRATAPAAADATLQVFVGDARGRGLAHVGAVLRPAAAVDPVLHRRRAVTDADGVLRWPPCAAGAYRLEFDRGVQVDLELRAGANEQRAEVPGGATASGRVVDASGRPIAGADVWLSSDVDGPWRGGDVAATDADGRFTLPQVPDGAFLAARHPQFVRSDVHRFDGARDAVGIELQLGARGGVVEVCVEDAHGAPVRDALVFVGEALDAMPLWLAQGAMPWRAPPFEGRTDAAGRVQTFAFAGGQLPVSVRAMGFAPQTAAIDVQPGRTNEVVVRLRAGGQVHGRAVDEAGAAIAGAQVVFRSDEPSGWIDVATDVDGAFRFECLPDGGADIAARANGHAPRLTTVEVVAGAVSTCTLALPRARAVRGLVVRGDAPCGEATVRATWPPSALAGEQMLAKVDRDGAFAFAAAAAARPRLELQLAGEPLWRPVDAQTSWSGDVATVRLADDFAASAWLEGSLRCADGRALAAARLFVCRDGVQWAEVGKSGDDGVFALGPLPPARYDLFAETTVPSLPSVPVGTFALAAGERLRVDGVAPATGSIDLEFVRGDGAPVGDLAITLVGRELQRRYVLACDAHLQQVLLPGDYDLFVMGSRVQWLEAMPVHVDAGVGTVRRVELPPAARCTLALRGLPRPDDGEPLSIGVRERWHGAWSSTFTLLADAPFRLTAVLAAGDYVLEHRDRRGTEWRGTFTATGAGDLRPIVVQMAPRQNAKPNVK